MIKIWSKGTVPLVSQQANATQNASTREGLLSLVLKKGQDDEASATGAGISMAFSEALSDDGELTGRGSPIMRGGITGGMTFLGGSLHTLPFLIPELHLALVVAYIVVAVELVLIAGI